MSAFYLVLLLCSNYPLASSSSLVVVAKRAGALLGHCLESGSSSELGCLRNATFQIINSTLTSDSLEIYKGIRLVKLERASQEAPVNRSLFSKLDEFLNNRVLRFPLSWLNSKDPVEGRRRKKNMMLTLMMFGALALGSIMIPMGFQFLAVLGGKALLLAKMALMLSSIQGLKKIATSNYNYGLYSTAGHGYGQWPFDRQWPYGQESQLGYSYDLPPETNQGHVDLYHPLHPRIDRVQPVN